VITAVEATEPYTQLRKEFDTEASRVDVMPARCVKCIADVDKSRPGLFLQPIGDSQYAFVNHARWDYGVPRLWLRMFTKPSFWSFVQKNMNENQTGSMPTLCHLA
jgi:hypothetical protein